MFRTSRRACTLFTALAILLCSLAQAGEAPENRAAQPVANAQRADAARFVHRIELKDADGNVLGPKSLVPYSPRQTCTSAKCHDYGTISQGSHTVMFADPTPDPKRPPIHVWTEFDEETGTQHPLSHGWLPAAKQPFKAKTHKTPFDLARELGAYHPGGGRYELDSSGQRYDTTLAASLALRDDEQNADYFDSRWDQSGVLEVDCLVCHQREGYDHVERGTQISVLNFKHAATVGAGFGTVEGKTIILPKTKADAPEPASGAEPPIQVHYKPGLFDGHGKVDVNVGRPPDANCLFCHRKPAKDATPWSDCWDADVHTKSGLACVDCHHATPTHAIFGSRRHGEMLAGMDGFKTLSCEGCHTAGRLGSPAPEHRGLPKFHLKEIACETCHSGPHPRQMPLAIEKPTNPLWGTPGGAMTGSGPTVWTPVFVKADGQIRPVMRMLPAFYARKMGDGFEPLPVSRVKSRIKKLAGTYVKKHNDLQEDLKTASDAAAKAKLIGKEAAYRAKVGITDAEIQAAAADASPGLINSDAEIAILLKLLTKKSDDPDRNYQPMLFVGGNVYSLDDANDDPLTWTLQIEPSPLADPIDLAVAHSVRPAAQSLGAQGCLECHNYASPFWHSVGITRAVGADGQPEGAPFHARIGMPALLRALGDLGARFVQPYARWAILLIVLAMALHYVAFGPKVRPPEEVQEYIRRFGMVSRLAHFTLFLSFLVLAATGICMVSGVNVLLSLRTSSVHGVFAYVLVGAMLLACLGSRARVPAGRPSAGQRVLFWLPGLVVVSLAVTGGMLMFEAPSHWLPLAYTVHKTCGYLMILAVLGYVYLDSFAKPGTLGVPFSGKVIEAWLTRHPNYAEKALQDDEKKA